MSWWLWALVGVGPAVVLLYALPLRMLLNELRSPDTRSMGFDLGRDAQGNRLFLDTANNWASMVEIYDREIAREVDFLGANRLSFNRPPGDRDWGRHWLNRIRYLQKPGTENPEKHISYIVHTRRHAGLPDLEGHEVARGTDSSDSPASEGP
ncbi:hypothetical protein OG357_04265 [Streptomyces sp. NBC_01255]|uniref:hypothetical protein n=1 Tax=Streptomyces sp. NBC_01255 TaxID=2903798 RepID=UPI002E340855|nr:hypothetical protein [Streptomyces sp. NBC_01255]